MVVTVASMLIAAALVALVLASTLSSHGTPQTGVANAPGVGLADNLQAQQTLSTSLTAVTTSAGATGDFSAITADRLSAANPSITYVEGPSSRSSDVSVATSATSESVTLVARAAGGTCWVVWAGTGGIWYGAQSNQASCTAPSLDVAPMASPVSATSIGWQRNGFPAA
jgi:hypothetical protein